MDLMSYARSKISKLKFQLNLLKGSSLSKLSREISKISLFARGLAGHAIGAGSSQTLASKFSQRCHDNFMNSLICLVFLVKGLLSH